MDDDQQFCLRWNNHQSTLISVFDTLLENGTLVDCTLAAEGKFLKAHKVVLSACSPYFAALLSQQYDKHPIFILKDVKFQELRAMMDYMYRGEVNISQDQLAALLKAAESLQIKGLSDSRGSSSSQQQKSEATASKTLPPPVPANKASGLTIENKRPLKSVGTTDLLDAELSGSREGSTSPTSRKRKKIRRKSIETNNLIDNHDQHSNSSSHSMHTTTTSLANQSLSATVVTSAAVNTNQLQPNSATSLSAPSNNITNVLSVATIKKTENIHHHQQQNDSLKILLKQQQNDALKLQLKQQQLDDDDDGDENEDDENDDEQDLMDNDNDGNMQQQSSKHINRHHQMETDIKNISQSELLIEPKNEYDDGHDENVEDLTLDDEELLEDMDQAGPSHGGEGSSQGYAQWQMERAQDEAFMVAQDAGGGQHRDAQEPFSMLHTLLSEPESYKYPLMPYANDLSTVVKVDDAPAQCPNCKRIYANKEKVRQHIKKYCLKEKKYQCMFCQYRSKRKDHIIRHADRVHPSQVNNKLQLGLIKSVTDAFIQIDNVDGGGQSGENSEFMNLNFSGDYPIDSEKYDYNGDITTIDDSDENEDNF